MKFSFIVASIGRDQQLQNCIDSIEKAYDYRKDFGIEILVVFQNIKENDCNIKIRYSELTTIYYINGKGLSRARNYAIKRSKGDFLIFLDDDAQIKENFLNILAESISITAVEALCGRILEKSTDRCFGLCFMNDKKKYLDRTDFRYFMGSSHVLKKSVIEKIGFYDERFGVGAKYPGAEESDMFFRLKRQGLKVIYLPELIFYHPIFYLTPASQVFNYSYAVGAMLTKQMFSDSKYLFIYAFIITESIFKSFIRMLQNLLFTKTIAEKNKRFQFNSVFKGTIKGIIDYLKFK